MPTSWSGSKAQMGDHFWRLVTPFAGSKECTPHSYFIPLPYLKNSLEFYKMVSHSRGVNVLPYFK
jgi:hypothetical protein